MTAPPGFAFGPSDEVAVGCYLLPRLLGWPFPVQIDGVIVEDDPLSAPPWELLERNGRKDEAFFFAEWQARDGKGSRQKRTCAGGGWWEGQKTSAEGDKMAVPDGSGREAAWRKSVFNFHGVGDGKKGSMGWVMHEYAVTAPDDLAQSRLRLYRIRTSSHARKLSLAMEVPPALGLAPGFIFAPEDDDLIAHYLVPGMLGQHLPVDGLIISDDPLSVPPWELLKRNGCKNDAFFFALGQVKSSSKSARQKRACVGGGFWNGEKTCIDGQKVCVPALGGAEVVWRKKAFSFQEAGDKGSTGWVMHEYAITVSDHLAEKRLMLYRIRFSGHGKKRKRAGGDSCADEEAHAAARYRGAEDALLDMPSSQQPICSSSAVVEDNSNGHDCIDGDQDAASVTAPDEHGLTPFIDDNGELDVNAALDYFMEIAAHQEPDIQDIIYCTKLLAPTPPYYSVGANLVASPTQGILRVYMEPAAGPFPSPLCPIQPVDQAWGNRVAEDVLLDMPSSQQPICSSSAVVEDNSNGRDCIDGDQDAASVTAPDEHGLTPFIDDNGELDVNAALDYFMDIAAHQEPDIQDIIYCTKLLAPTPPYYSVGANLVSSPTQGMLCGYMEPAAGPFPSPLCPVQPVDQAWGNCVAQDALLDMPSLQQPICSSSAVVEDNFNGRDCIDGDQDAASATAPDEHGLTPFIDDNGELDVGAALDYFMEIAAHKEPDIQDIIYWTKFLGPTPPYSSVGASLVASPTQGRNFWMPRSCLNSAYRCLRDWPSSTWLNTPRLTMVE